MPRHYDAANAARPKTVLLERFSPSVEPLHSELYQRTVETSVKPDVDGTAIQIG